MKKDTEYGLYAEQFAEEQWKEMGERIKVACSDAGYKLSDLARLLGVEVRQIYRITKGELPCKSEYIYEFSQVLGVSTDYLFLEKKMRHTVGYRTCARTGQKNSWLRHTIFCWLILVGSKQGVLQRL